MMWDINSMKTTLSNKKFR